MRSVQPIATKIKHVRRRVVRVIPETGLEVLPTIPTVRDVTATKKNPSTASSTIVVKFMADPGRSQRVIIMAKDPIMSQRREISRSVLGIFFLGILWNSSVKPTEKVLRIIGAIFVKLITPPIATEPAPM